MHTLRINLNDVLDLLRTLPETTQFDMNDRVYCLFGTYLGMVHPGRDIDMGAYIVRLGTNKYQLPARVVQIVDQFIWQDEKDDAESVISRDQAIDAIEQNLRKNELSIGARVRILAQGRNETSIPCAGTIYDHLSDRPAPWHVRPDTWPSHKAGIAYMAEELELIKA